VITAHTATITDDEAPPVANFTTSTQSSVSESGTMTITIQLSAISTLNVSVPFTVNGSSTATGGTDYTITGSPVLINAGSTSGTITITITSDFRDEPNETVVVNMGSPTNASLGATVTHTATITDDDLSGFTISPTLGLVTDESGSQSSFTVRLNSQPTDNVTLSVSSDDLTEGSVSPASLTFTSANWNTNQTVTLTGVDDLIDDGDIVYHAVTAAAVSTDANYSGLNPTDVTITNSDNDIAGFTLSPTVITTTEAAGAGNTATFTVKLNTLPTANVTIGLSSNNTNEGTVSPASLTFTTANWNVNQTVTVTGVDDFVDDGNIAYSVVTASAISTDGAYNNIDPINISATNQDDDVRGITVSAISGSTSEALGTATFTVVLSSQPTADVGIGLASNNTAEGTVSPGSLTFTTANWNAPQTVTVTGVDDFVDDGDIVYSILTAAATGGDYAGINAADVTVTNIDNDTRGFTVSAISGSTTEAGGTANFTIVLNSQPTANVNLGLSSSNVAEGTISVSSLSFTTANWNTAQTVTVTGVDDFVDDGNTTYTIITAAATGGDYATLNAADVSVQNIDNDAAGFAVSPISLVVTEAAGPGQTATFTVKLNSQPTANVSIGISSSDLTEGTVAPASLTFTSGNWNTNQTLTVTGVDDPMVDGNINFSINNAAATSTDIVYNGLNPADVSVTNSDNDIAGIAVTPASGLTTSEAGGATSFTVMLTSQPSANVVIGISSSDLSEGTVSPSSITFTPGNWNVPQAIDVTGEDDFIVDGNVTYNIITAPAVSSDSNYSGMNTLDVSASNTDDDVAGFTVSLISGNLTEAGGTATFSIVLNSQPSANVIVGISSSDLSEGTVLQASHTFTGGDWNTPHVVTVTGVDDFIVDGDISFSILTAAATSSDSYYNGLNPSDVSVLNLDNDVRDITVGTLSGSTSEPGGTATFTVVLTTIPTANVSIGISSDDLTEGTVSTASLTFTPANWNTPQTVIISGVNDLVQDGDISYNIILAAATGGDYAGINASDVPVVNLDNDVADITITPSGGTTSESGTSVVFSVVLTSQPTANVSFSIVSGDTGEGTVSPSSLSFTTANWNVAKTFTVTGVADFAIDGDTPYTITVSSSSTDALYNLVDNNLPMTNTDIDIAGFIINPASGLITTEAGGTATFTVRLNTQPTANVTLGLSSNDLTEGTVSPASLTFTNGNWNTAQTVTVTGVNDILTDGDIVFSIVTAGATSTDPNYSSLNPADVSVTNTDLTPTISGFSPSPVCYGSGVSVVISGTKFTGATFVRFNGVNSSYTVNSSVQITAVLPATATTGVISVITPTGTAVSSSSLIVTPTVTINAFSPANSTRCQGAGIVTTTTTANNATGITYSLDATTAAFPGNSINAATGEVNYAVGWSGTTTITANAAGCNGPATTTHVVTVNPLTGTPVFTGGDTSICQDDPDETYSATAANSTSVTFSVLPVEAGTIGAGTGIMNWSPSFFGTATIKVTATGICGTTSSDRTVIVNPLPATGEIVGD
jgi:hypothetical protein